MTNFFRNKSTSAMVHDARYCWRRFSDGRFSSACSVYAVWTALRNSWTTQRI